NEVIVLARNRSAGPREAQSDRRNACTKTFHSPDQFFRQIVRLAPHNPSAAQGRKTELMPGRVDGFHARNAEVPGQTGMNERSDKTSAGAVDVERNIQPPLFL